LRHDSGRGRIEEGLRGAVERHQGHQLPDLGATREQQRSRDGLGHGAHAVGREHDDVAREPVGPDPADEHEHHHRDHPRGEDQSKRRGRLLELEHRERERHGHELVSEVRDGAAREEQPEAAVSEGGEQVLQASP
jgi:hypothetical protein